jgi:hypothetical protein
MEMASARLASFLAVPPGALGAAPLPFFGAAVGKGAAILFGSSGARERAAGRGARRPSREGDARSRDQGGKQADRVPTLRG